MAAEVKTEPGAWAPDVAKLSPDPMDAPYLGRIFARLPARFRPSVAKSYRQRYDISGQRAANTWLREEIDDSLTAGNLSLAASDTDICHEADRRARHVRELLADTTATTAEAIRMRLESYASDHGANLPAVVSLSGLIARLTDGKWWRRNIRRHIGREIEKHAIAFGMVHRRAGLYASDEACARHAEQQRRNRLMLEGSTIENEDGEQFDLDDIADKSMANPALRKGELMTRARGCEEYAAAFGHVAAFYTITAPSRMHARKAVSETFVVENPKYDGTSPREAQAYISQQWGKARAKLARMGLVPYGVRVAEPHHDGTPHWHVLLFMPAAAMPTVTEVLRHYASEIDAEELGSDSARKARFHAERIDPEKGSAAGYLMKYIGKNIDGINATGESIGDDFEAVGVSAADGAQRVRAWASTWSIRQFQTIGQPSVTIWRELRRLREMGQGELFPFWTAADSGQWKDFMAQMGGIGIPRKDRPLQLEKVAAPGMRNAYGEDAGPQIVGVSLRGVIFETRKHEWTVRRKPQASAPWTRVNNCTPKQSQGLQREWSLTSGGRSAKNPHWWNEARESYATAADADGFPLGFFRNGLPVSSESRGVERENGGVVSAPRATPPHQNRIGGIRHGYDQT